MLRLIGEWGGAGNAAAGLLVLALAVGGFLACRRWLKRGGRSRSQQERERVRRDFWGWG